MPSQYGFKVLIYIGPDSWHSQSKPRPGSQVSHWPLHRLVGREMSAENSQGSGAAKRFGNDCQFGLVSAEHMPKREGMPVIKQFRGERYFFWAPKPFQPFSVTICFASVRALLAIPACSCVHSLSKPDTVWKIIQEADALSMFTMQPSNPSLISEDDNKSEWIPKHLKNLDSNPCRHLWCRTGEYQRHQQTPSY